MADVVGTLTIEMAANIARLTEDFAAAKAEVSKSVGEIQHVVEEMRDHIQENMARVTEAIKMVQEAFLAVGAAIAGGSAMKEAIGESSKMTQEAIKLGKTLGMTATEASILNVALEDAFVSNDTMQAANKALTKQLLNNEEAFKNLGVATREQNGSFRSSLDIMLDVNEELLKFKEGTDRNIEGSKIYGKTWSEVSGVLLLNRELMEEAAKKANALGLVVGQENVDATLRFRHAMIDVEDVIKAVMKTIGDALMPVLTQLGNWFSDIGPAAVVAIKGAIGGLTAVFHGLVMSAKLAADAVKGVWNMLNADLHGKSVGDAWHNMLDEMTADATETQKKLTELFSTPTATKKKEGGETSDGKDKKQKQEKSRMPQYEEELAAMKLAAAGEEQTREEQKEKEIAFWVALRDAASTSAADRIAIQRKISSATLAEIEMLKKAHEAAQKAQTEGEAKVAEAQYAITLASLKAAEQAGQISKVQALEAEQAVQDAILQIKMNGLQTQMNAIHDKTTAEYIRLNAELATIDAKRQAQVLKSQGEVAAATNTASQKAIDSYQKMLQPISSGFEKMITGMIQGTTTWQKSWGNILKAIEAELVSAAVKMATEWVAKEIWKTMATAQQIAAREAMEKSAAATSLATSGELMLKQIAGYAATAFAGVTAFLAPMMGPYAVAGAAVVSALVLAEGAHVMSAAGGYNIPSGVNPLTQLHQNEMVLPASIANPLRDMISQGGSMQGGGDTHFHITAMDSQSVAQFFDKHGAAIVKSLRTQGRAFNTP